MAGPSQGHVVETPPIQRATGTQRRLPSGENTAEGPFSSSCKGENTGGHNCASKTVTGALHSPPRWAEPRGLATVPWPSLAFWTASADSQELEAKAGICRLRRPRGERVSRHLRWGKWEGGGALRADPAITQTHTMHPVEVVVLQPKAHVQHTLGQHEGLQDATHCGAMVRVPNAEGRRKEGDAAHHGAEIEKTATMLAGGGVKGEPHADGYRNSLVSTGEHNLMGRRHTAMHLQQGQFGALDGPSGQHRHLATYTMHSQRQRGGDSS